MERDRLREGSTEGRLDQTARRSYSSPVLSEFGRVSEITAGGVGSVTELEASGTCSQNQKESPDPSCPPPLP
jgi:hypothetical protein